MKHFSLTLVAFILLNGMACKNESKPENESVPATDTTSKATSESTTPAAALDSAAMQKAWESYMTPGDMHKWLASLDGKWDAEMTFWNGPDAAASAPNKAVVENKMTLGGRYQLTTYKGQMMGMDFEGHGTMAYDNAKKEFISTWIDNTGTGLLYVKGPYETASKTITMSGKAVNPATGQEENIREVVKTLDDKTQVMEMYYTKDGKEYKGMEIKLVKR